MICQSFVPNSCSLPPTPPLDLTGWVAKPKPNPLPPPKRPSGQRLKVLHLSDFHIDPRAYQTFVVMPHGYRTLLSMRPKLRFFLLPQSVSTSISYTCIFYHLQSQSRLVCSSNYLFLPFRPLPVLILCVILILHCRLRDRRRGKLYRGLVLSLEYLQFD